MRVFRSARWLLLALLLSVIPTSSYAGVFISVGFAPPILPVYEQPLCPEPGLMWTPGYWAYGEDGYYWVPGAWVPAPYEGALWTPGYWGWSDGLYVFHDGYWGPHVGYYGGVNYGFGYMGIGFVGGEWRGHEFAYNTAVVRVNTTVIRNVYVDRTIVERNTIINDRHVAYTGGPGGIRHDPGPEERMAMRDQHVAPTSFQQQHFQAARSDRTAYFKANGGRPQNVAVARPLPREDHPAPGGFNRGVSGAHEGPVNGAHANPSNGFNNRPTSTVQPNTNGGPQTRTPDYRTAPPPRNDSQVHPTAPTRTPDYRTAPPPPHNNTDVRPTTPSRPQYEQRPNNPPPPRPKNESKEKEPKR
jgi:hypothetical protein